MIEQNRTSNGLTTSQSGKSIQETFESSDPVQNAVIKILVAKCADLKGRTLEDKTISISELYKSVNISEGGCDYEQVCKAINTIQKTLVPVRYRFVDPETNDAEVIGLLYFSEIYTNFSPADPALPEKLKNEENPYFLTVYWNPVIKNFVTAIFEGAALPSLLAEGLELRKIHLMEEDIKNGKSTGHQKRFGSRFSMFLRGLKW